MSEDQEKTEEPTPHKIEESRKKGDVAQSKEFASFIVFFGLTLGMYLLGKSMLQRIVTVIKESMDAERADVENAQQFVVLASGIIENLLWMVGPLLAMVCVFGVASYVGQFGLLFASEKLQPKLEKINPLKGFQRIFSKDTLVELVKSVLKVVVLGAIMFFVVLNEREELLSLSSYSTAEIFFYFMELLAKLMIAMLIFVGALGLLDFAYQKWSHNEKMKMSMREVKDEMKQREGDPLIKSRVRQVQRERARARMMEEIPSADVVVTNPTHLAVALKYKKGQMAAPKVVAKGAGVIAQKIKEVAMNHNVPIVEKKALARYLYKNVEVNQSIPESLYTAVAEVLAYVYRIKNKFRQARGFQSAGA